MNLQDLKDKYSKAHEAYLKYKDTNKTNNIEQQYMPEIIECIKTNFINSEITVIGDNILNYLGVDVIIDGGKILADIKVCQHCNRNNVIIDAYKHDENGNWFSALDVKLNDWFIFLNADNIIFVPTKYIKIPPIEECFFFNRDIYKTTLKASIDLSNVRKRVYSRKAKN